MGLNGSKSKLIFFSVFPSSINMTPQKMHNPLVGVYLYSLISKPIINQLNYLTFLGRCDSSDDRLLSNSTLDVLRLTEFLSEELAYSVDIVLGRDDQRDHAGAVTFAVFEFVD